MSQEIPLATIIKRYLVNHSKNKSIDINENVKQIIEEINKNHLIIQDIYNFANSRDDTVFINIINGYFGPDFLENHLN